VSSIAVFDQTGPEHDNSSCFSRRDEYHQKIFHDREQGALGSEGGSLAATTIYQQETIIVASLGFSR